MYVYMVFTYVACICRSFLSLMWFGYAGLGDSTVCAGFGTVGIGCPKHTVRVGDYTTCTFVARR